MTSAAHAESGPERVSAEGLARLARASFVRAWSPAQFAAELAAPGGRVWWEGPARAPRAALLANRVIDEMEIRSVAVAPDARRRGAAARLLGCALRDARAEGVAVVHLEVRAGNVAARGLYAAAGFAQVGLRRGYYADGEDALLLRLDLGPASGAEE